MARSLAARRQFALTEVFVWGSLAPKHVDKTFTSAMKRTYNLKENERWLSSNLHALVVIIISVRSKEINQT